MSVFEESNHDDDFVILTVDIDDCPIAELPLTEIYDVTSSHLKNDYLDTLRAYITQQLKDTTWLEDQSVSPCSTLDSRPSTAERTEISYHSESPPSYA
ncbi:hypothetical protein MHU86_12366 [Fragilaria crotonensis]|nr:hypothetical protein MHU86_12366 [Fragilaria crotonensis]